MSTAKPVKIKYLGCAGHFICSDRCRFRLHTQVGNDYRVSTVGNYFPVGSKQREEVGCNRLFETYVFRTTGIPADGSEGCGCQEVVEWCEVDSWRANTSGEAAKNHEAAVVKYAAIASQRS